MSRSELKALAKKQLGGGIFQSAWLLALVACLIVSAINSVASSIIVGALIVFGPLTYGLSYVFLKQARDNQPMELGDVFKGFTDDFGGTLLLGLLQTVFILLWSLLFIIPGIIKSYAYAMAFYIKVDNPSYGWSECLKASTAMMKGHKMELFVLDLSFLGWYIVGALCLGVGTLWVAPYHSATHAQYYRSLAASAGAA